MLLIVIVLVFVAGAIFGATQRRFPGFENSAKLTQTVLTTLGIGLAAYWYLVERKGEPHADITQKAEAVKLTDEVAAVEVQVQVKNLGGRLLELQNADIKLQQVSPPAFDANALEGLQDKAYFGADRFPGQPIARDGIFQGAELKWPRLNRFAGALQNRIEPGETDLIVATFLVRCSLSAVRISTQIERKSSGFWNKEPYWWKARSLVDLRPACTKDDGEREDKA